MSDVRPRYKKGTMAISGSPFVIGPADALYVSSPVTSGLVLTLLDGTTLTLGSAPDGTVIPIACTRITFDDGIVCAMRA